MFRLIGIIATSLILCVLFWFITVTVTADIAQSSAVPNPQHALVLASIAFGSLFSILIIDILRGAKRTKPGELSLNMNLSGSAKNHYKGMMRDTTLSAQDLLLECVAIGGAVIEETKNGNNLYSMPTAPDCPVEYLNTDGLEYVRQARELNSVSS